MSAKNAILLCLILLVVSGCATWKQHPSTGEVQSAISNAAQVIDAWNNQTNSHHNTADIAAMRGQLDILKATQKANQDQRAGIALAYYIGSVENSLTVEAKIFGGPLDRAMQEDALDNFDSVLAYGQDLAEWHVRLMDTNYLAGSVSWALDGVSERTLRYWNACADQGHPGCINNIAFELTKSPSASNDDIRRALDMHAKVVKTGNAARCAGEFSAVTMALLIHFTGVEHPGDDDIALLDTAQSLYRSYKIASGTPDPCSGGRIGLYEYMVRLDRGDRQKSYLDNVLEQSASPYSRRIADFLLNKVSDAELNQAIAGATAQDACGYHFFAAWKAKQKNDLRTAQEHYTAMIKLNAEECGPDTLMMQRFLKVPAGKGPKEG